MTSILYANGCSFTAGSELEQEHPELRHIPPRRAKADPRSELYTYRQRHAWPSRLADLAGFERVINEARGGGSNARCVRMTLAFVSRYVASGGSPADLVVCLGFTDLARTERYDPDESGADTEGWQLVKPRIPNDPNALGGYWRRCTTAYYRYIYSERQAAITFFEQLVSMQAVLAALRIRYYCWEATADNPPRVQRHWENVKHLASLLAPRHHRSIEHAPTPAFATGRSFEDWSNASGLPLGRMGHPFSEGHLAWAEILLGDLRARQLV